ncbi:MAG: phenylacetate--CoA ligase family protein [Pirellulales bacterium]|nr:phenylacetate--CoA ligase family protein [Pirellulales bacterium]
MDSSVDRQSMQRLDRDSLEQHQLQRLNDLLGAVLPTNHFYAHKFSGVAPQLASLDQLGNLPYTSKTEIVGEDEDGWAANRTFERTRYTRFHQTSGTRGRPLIVLDTAEDWHWWIEGWQYVLDAAKITSGDVCMLAFSFGPFIGFWSAFDAVLQRGCLGISGGGLSTHARLERMETLEATCLFCTPSYALRMAEVASEVGIDLRQLSIRTIVVAGEPGGSIVSVRNQIETAWDARVLDHSGATEIGPWGYGTLEGGGLYVNEAEFLAEFINYETGVPAAEGELSELVLTTLGRAGNPVIRYRTGDLVRPRWSAQDENIRFVFLEGGVLGRVDDMLIIRGVNILPSSVEQVIRNFPEVAEYRITAQREGALDRLQVEVEDRQQSPDRIAAELQLRLGLNIEVAAVPIGTLPRFEGKAERFFDRRKMSG